jgi:UDP-galactopyranose mutase
MYTLLSCLKCFKGFTDSKTLPEKGYDSKAANSIDHEEIEVDIQLELNERPLETERNDSFMQGTINEYDILSFGASSIHCVSERCSSMSDCFELRASRGVSPLDYNLPHTLACKQIPNNQDQNTCLVLRPPRNFAFMINPKGN